MNSDLVAVSLGHHKIRIKAKAAFVREGLNTKVLMQKTVKGEGHLVIFKMLFREFHLPSSPVTQN